MSGIYVYIGTTEHAHICIGERLACPSVRHIGPIGPHPQFLLGDGPLVSIACFLLRTPS